MIAPMTDPRVLPTRVKAPRGGRIMEIGWADGHVGFYPHEILRGYCPCATCQGHGGTIRFIPGGEIEARLSPGGDLELREVQQVGNYALKLAWGDGHDTGIYTYRFLRSLCRCAECTTPETAACPELSRS
jgi:prepilin-type processing-associated H-X9-DG protein